MSDETAVKLAILYADVSGSTRIYETWGDAVARKNIDHCLKILSDITAGHEGQVIKTIGDEIMCSFPNPVRAALSAKEMQQALRDASEAGRFDIGAMHVKIGWHYGTVNQRAGETVGEAPVTAQQVISLAKADEILASEQSLDNIPDEIKHNIRLIDSVQAEAWSGMLNVYAVPWEEEDDVTSMGGVAAGRARPSACASLVLEYAGRTVTVDAAHARCSIGRGTENDLCVLGQFTSRLHAEIVFSHGNISLRDKSTNGTVIINADGHASRVHRESARLTDRGTLCFGGMPETDPDAAVRFRCEKTDAGTT